MNKFWLTSLLCWLAVSVLAQAKLPQYPDSLFSTYYQQRAAHFKTLPPKENDIIFLGNSITDGAEWSELFGDPRILNRGISGDRSFGVIARLGEIIRHKPAKVFLLIGINDLAANTTPDSIARNIFLIADQLHQQTPVTKLFVQSILPVTDIHKKFGSHTSRSPQILQLNELLKQNEARHYYTFVNIHDAFCDADGKLNAQFTNDGLHQKGEGYLLWKHLLYPHIKDLRPKASVIPQPRQLQWEKGFFPAYKCYTINIRNKSLKAEAEYLQKELIKKNIRVGIDSSGVGPYIALDLGHVNVPDQKDEAYHLQVNARRVSIVANSEHGVFNGIQTLLQLLRDDTMADACDITDWPAFPWRGYMVDVGRNFQSVQLLEQQIDAMTLFKLNVFHLHLTEDIAWRLAIRKYPELTDPQNMQRDQGGVYTEADIRNLADYCAARHIAFVPEIDIPGHSAAFKRAFHTDMQSPAGAKIVEDILNEIVDTYHFRFLHIGGDEVKITDTTFLPRMTSLLTSKGIKVIGWQPGGNLTKGTIRQLWSANVQLDPELKYVDSRHLYLNHMDPLESVVTIFNRQLCNRPKADKSCLGAEICVWNDRAVDDERDILRMNPVYPGMLAFAERSWQGGGKQEWIAIIPDGSPSEHAVFADFEDRLLDQKKVYFRDLPFTYTRQSEQKWDLYGPYPNDGDLAKIFPPETERIDQLKPASSAIGGTIILRHWWYPAIKGILDNPRPNTTWYASTLIWSDADDERPFWISFDDISRSHATASPSAGTWDERKSALWVNDTLIPPPLWKHAGKKSDLELPLIDEGYAYRKPTVIKLKKGWNKVLVKLPVGGFTAGDWNNPVKWMFTFAPANL